jgi:hypothetical protein
VCARAQLYTYINDPTLDPGQRFGLPLPQYPVTLYCNPSLSVRVCDRDV